ncbi:hypothetical protein GCM10008944_01450 [Cytobacillus oceanisediminis]
MSDLLNGAEQPWDVVSGPVECGGVPMLRTTATDAPERQVAAMNEFGRRAGVVLREMGRTIADAMRDIVPVVEGAAADARRDLLDGDHPERDEIRAQVTVAQLQGLAALADRGEA